MRYEQRMRKYWQKKLEDPLPKLPEDERIYLNVPYMARDFAKYSHCGFDPERKLWFTGSLNRNLYDLVELYGVNEATSEKANLSKAQDKLIDGLAEYGARWAKEDGFPEMAEEMEKRVGISKGIEKIIEPQAPKRSRGYEMEL